MKFSAILATTAFAATEVQNRPYGDACVQKKGYNHYQEHPIASIVEAGPREYNSYWEPQAINAADNSWFDARYPWGSHWDRAEYPEAPEQSGLCAMRTVQFKWWGRTYTYKYKPSGCNDLAYWGIRPGNADLAKKPIFMTVDLGAVVSVGEIMIDHWGHFRQGDWNHAPSSIKVYGSTCLNRRSKSCDPKFIKEFTTMTGKSSCEPQYFYLPETKARFMKIEITGKHDKSSPYVVVDELKFYGVADGRYNKDGVKDHKDDFMNQKTASPTPAPKSASKTYKNTHKNADEQGAIDGQVDQTDRTAMPTTRPTAFPTKDQDHKFGSTCKFFDRKNGIKFEKPVGWVGPGPKHHYCNAWMCERTKEKFSFKGSMRKCNVMQHGKKFCSHTKCKRVMTEEVLKNAIVAFYTFDEKDTFKNNIADENFMTQQQTYLTSIWTQNWYRVYRYWWGYTRYLHIGTTTNRSFQTLLLRSGECQIESFRGNMAWHVSGNKMGSSKKACSIRTKDIITFAKNWDQCRFALRIRDVDHEYQSKEEDDKICFQVMDHKKRAVLQNKVCQKNDIRRRLVDYTNGKYHGSYAQTNNLDTCGWYGCIGWYGYRGYDTTSVYSYELKASSYGKSHRSKVLKSDWIPTRNYRKGVYVKINAVTNDIREHWYADDLAIECREMRKVIQVRSDHREEIGGKHVCGYSKHSLEKEAKGCACVCSGARRQDANGFSRSLNEISKEFDLAVRKTDELPTTVMYNFNFNNKGSFTGHVSHVVLQIKAFRFWYWTWLIITPVGTCGIERKYDTTESFYLQGNRYSNMAWHVQNNAGAVKECTMQTQNAWKPVKFDQYRSCSVSLEVTDLDEVEHRQIWSRGSGCPEGFHSHGRYWGWNNCWSHYAQKSNDDYVCFEVLGANGKRVKGTKKTCQKNDITEGYGATKTIKTKFFVVPDTGINVRMTAKTNSIKEHWYSDNLAITCKKSWRVVQDGHDATVNGNKFDAAFNSNNLYTKHDNLDYNENDHTYNGQRVAHFHNGN
jgi:hypothetical protein